MFEVGEKVKITNSDCVGVIEKVSTWGKVNYGVISDSPCYFVRVQKWDMNTNGGRWLGGIVLEKIK